MKKELTSRVKKLNQQYAYTSLQMHEAVGRKAGLPGTDHKYLSFFIQKGEMTAGELARLTNLTTGAVTGLIDRLEAKDLVKRKLAKDDRRKVIIEPDIPRIMTFLSPLYESFRAKAEEMNASFSNEELKVIESYLVKSIKIMDEITHELNASARQKL